MKALIAALAIVAAVAAPVHGQRASSLRQPLPGNACQGWASRQAGSVLDAGEEVVFRVNAGSPAVAAGLQVGDVILSIDSRTPPQPGDTVLFRLRRAEVEVEARLVVGMLREADGGGLVCGLWPDPRRRMEGIVADSE